MKPFSTQTDRGLQPFQAGTIVVQAGIQEDDVLPGVIEILTDAALSGIDVYSLTTTLTATGPDLGSEHFPIVRPIKPLIIGGKGTSSYGVGEQWHLLDQRLKIASPIIEIQHLNDANLADYTHILMADGSYTALRNGARTDIVRWVQNGGVLIAVGAAASWVEELCTDADPEKCTSDETENATEDPVESRAYSDFPKDNAQLVIGGAIVATMADLSHPLVFGYQRPELPLFRRGTIELTPSQNPYSSPVRYTNAPLLAGFMGKERLEAIKGQAAVIAEKQGAGLVVRFANTPLFRGFWRGTEKLFINALYFGQVVKKTEVPKLSPPSRAN